MLWSRHSSASPSALPASPTLGGSQPQSLLYAGIWLILLTTRKNKSVHLRETSQRALLMLLTTFIMFIIFCSLYMESFPSNTTLVAQENHTSSIHQAGHSVVVTLNTMNYSMLWWLGCRFHLLPAVQPRTKLPAQIHNSFTSEQLWGFSPLVQKVEGDALTQNLFFSK